MSASNPPGGNELNHRARRRYQSHLLDRYNCVQLSREIAEAEEATFSQTPLKQKLRMLRQMQDAHGTYRSMEQCLIHMTERLVYAAVIIASSRMAHAGGDDLRVRHGDMKLAIQWILFGKKLRFRHLSQKEPEGDADTATEGKEVPVPVRGEETHDISQSMEL